MIFYFYIFLLYHSLRRHIFSNTIFIYVTGFWPYVHLLVFCFTSCTGGLFFPPVNKFSWFVPSCIINTPHWYYSSLFTFCPHTHHLTFSFLFSLSRHSPITFTHHHSHCTHHLYPVHLSSLICTYTFLHYIFGCQYLIWQYVWKDLHT